MFCKTLSRLFDAIPDGDGGYVAVEVDLAGNQVNLGYFKTEEEAEEFALAERERQLADNDQFGVGA